MSEENKAIARREVEMFSTGDFSDLVATSGHRRDLSQDYVGHDPAMPEPIRGLEAL